MFSMVAFGAALLRAKSSEFTLWSTLFVQFRLLRTPTNEMDDFIPWAPGRKNEVGFYYVLHLSHVNAIPAI